MSTATLNLNLCGLPEQPPQLERFNRALILIRLKGRPVCKAILPVENGRLSVADL